MKYFIANWKANKNIQETEDWINSFISKIDPKNENIRIIICPPYPLITVLKNKVQDMTNIRIGSQDISTFEEGSYTGEVTAKTLVGLVDYSIIGHSERRKNFGEIHEVLFKKVELAKKYSIEPIFCIRDESDPIPGGVKFVAYEPVHAIGTGANEPADKTIVMKKKLNLDKNKIFIYGGSVSDKNAHEYLKTTEIDGFLVGKVSLDPERFANLVNLV